VNKEFEQSLAGARRSFDEVTQAGASLNQMLREGNFGQIEP